MRVYASPSHRGFAPVARPQLVNEPLTSPPAAWTINLLGDENGGNTLTGGASVSDWSPPTLGSFLIAVGAGYIDSATAARPLHVPPIYDDGGYTWTEVARYDGTDAPGFSEPHSNFSLNGILATAPADVDNFNVASAFSAIDQADPLSWYGGHIVIEVIGHYAAAPIAQVMARTKTADHGGLNSVSLTSPGSNWDDDFDPGNLVVIGIASSANDGGGFATPTVGGEPMTLVHANGVTGNCQIAIFVREINGAETGRDIVCSDLGDAVGSGIMFGIELQVDTETELPTGWIDAGAFDLTFGYGEESGVDGHLGAGSPDTYVVTTTADSGAGSLRTGLAGAISDRLVVFDPALAGQTITLATSITCSGDNITVDATAAPGVTLVCSGGSFRFVGTNILLAGLTWEATGTGQDALAFRRDSATAVDQRFAVYGCEWDNRPSPNDSDSCVDIIYKRQASTYGTFVGCKFRYSNRAMLVHSGETGGTEGNFGSGEGAYYITIRNCWFDYILQRWPLARDAHIHIVNTLVSNFGAAAAETTPARLGDEIDPPSGFQSWMLAENNVALTLQDGQPDYEGTTATTNPSNNWFSPSGTADGSQAMSADGTLLLTNGANTATEAEINPGLVGTPPYSDIQAVAATTALRTFLETHTGIAAARSAVGSPVAATRPVSAISYIANGDTITVHTQEGTASITDVELFFEGVSLGLMTETVADTWTLTLAGLTTGDGGILSATITALDGEADITAIALVVDVGSILEVLDTTITVTTTLTDVVKRRETVDTTIATTTTITDVVKRRETVDTTITATTPATEVVKRREVVDTSITATTTITDVVKRREPVLTTITATTEITEDFNGSVSETVDTTITATTTIVDLIKRRETVDTTITATTPASDRYRIVDLVTTTITTTTTIAESVKRREPVTTTIACISDLVEIGSFYNTVDTTIVATTPALDTGNFLTTVDTTITTTTTTTDVVKRRETVTTTITATITHREYSHERYTTTINATSEVTDDVGGGQTLDTLITCTTTHREYSHEHYTTTIAATTTIREYGHDLVLTTIAATTSVLDVARRRETVDTAVSGTTEIVTVLQAIEDFSTNVAGITNLVDLAGFQEVLLTLISGTSEVTDDMEGGLQTLDTSINTTTTLVEDGHFHELLTTTIACTTDTVHKVRITQTLDTSVAATTTLTHLGNFVDAADTTVSCTTTLRTKDKVFLLTTINGATDAIESGGNFEVLETSIACTTTLRTRDKVSLTTTIASSTDVLHLFSGVESITTTGTATTALAELGSFLDRMDTLVTASSSLGEQQVTATKLNEYWGDKYQMVPV